MYKNVIKLKCMKMNVSSLEPWSPWMDGGILSEHQTNQTAPFL